MQEKSIVENEVEAGSGIYKINVEKLMEDKEEYGNGIATSVSKLKDVYTIEINEEDEDIESYFVKYHGKKENEIKILGKIEGEEIDESVKYKIENKRAKSNDKIKPISSSQDVFLEDNLGNKVYIPRGFGIPADSGINVEEGIVIEDVDPSRETIGSQFVWIPVGDINVSTSIDSSGKINIALGRYRFDENGIETLVQSQMNKNHYQESTSSSAIENDEEKFYEFKDNTESQQVINKTYQNTLRQKT